MEYSNRSNIQIPCDLSPEHAVSVGLTLVHSDRFGFVSESIDISMSEPKWLCGDYPKEKLQQEIDVVLAQKMTSVKASEVLKAPQSTIRTHLKKPFTRIGAGRSMYLNTEEEAQFVELTKSLEKVGFKLTRKVLLRTAGQYLRRTTNHPRLKSEYFRLLSKKASCDVVSRIVPNEIEFLLPIGCEWWRDVSFSLVRNYSYVIMLQAFSMAIFFLSLLPGTMYLDEMLSWRQDIRLSLCSLYSFCFLSLLSLRSILSIYVNARLRFVALVQPITRALA